MHFHRSRVAEVTGVMEPCTSSDPRALVVRAVAAVEAGNAETVAVEVGTAAAAADAAVDDCSNVVALIVLKLKQN